MLQFLMAVFLSVFASEERPPEGGVFEGPGGIRLFLLEPGGHSDSSLEDYYIDQFSCNDDRMRVCIVGDYPIFIPTAPGEYSIDVDGQSFTTSISESFFSAGLGSSKSQVVIVESELGTFYYDFDVDKGVLGFSVLRDREQIGANLEVFILVEGGYLGSGLYR